MALCLSDQRAIDQLHLGRPPRFDVLEHRRIVRAPTFGRKYVHLPGVIMELDACRSGDTLALVDERVDDVEDRLPPKSADETEPSPVASPKKRKMLIGVAGGVACGTK